MTTDHFIEQGARLIERGYHIVPIRRGEKRPAITAWQNTRLTSTDLPRFPDHGVGVLCGQGDHPVVGVDIDVSHPGINEALRQWCAEHLGDTCERVGAAPRTLLVYRAASPNWTKGSSVQFMDPADPLKPSGKPNNQQVEILGLGQQFVAYHIHPDTDREYEWTDLFGGMANLHAAELPVVTEAQIDALLAEVARLVRATEGLRTVGTAESPVYRSGGDSDDLAALVDRTATPIGQMGELLAFLPNNDDAYDQWLRVGQALHHEYSGTADEDAALALWREYGSKSSKDRPGEYGYKWRSFGRHSGAPVTLRWLLKICGTARREVEHEARREALDRAKALIQAEDDSLKLGSPALVNELRALVPMDDPLMRTEIVAAWQARYKALTKATMPVTRVRALLLERQVPTVETKRPLTEFGNAERMLDRYGAGLMYVPEIDQWFSWSGVYWRKAQSVEIAHLAKETIRALPEESKDVDEERLPEFFEFCKISQRAAMVSNMVTLAASDPRVMVPLEELDKHPHLIGVKNGVVNLLTGALLEPDPALHITMICGCEYNPSARAPIFEQTLADVFYGDSEMTEFTLRTFGYALLGRPVEDIMFIAFGNGANGKSTIFNTVRAVFGHYARTAEAASFVSDNKQGNAGAAREDLVRLRGARFVYVNEPDENGELREGVVKGMTGGDAITARGLFARSSIEIDPTWVVFMPTNHKPIIKGNDNGIWRRMGMLPFERNFENDPTVPKDQKRGEKLRAEMPGILALIVRASLRYQQVGLALPPKVLAARDAYRSQMDLLAEWLDECCEVQPDAVSTMKDLWMSWEQFAKSRGLLNYIRSSTALGRRLDARFPARKGTGGVRVRLGIGVKPLVDIF